MALQQDAVINVADADLAVDVTGDIDFVVNVAMECDLITVAFSGGDVTTTTLQALCGTTLIRPAQFPVTPLCGGAFRVVAWFTE